MSKTVELVGKHVFITIPSSLAEPQCAPTNIVEVNDVNEQEGEPMSYKRGWHAKLLKESYLRSFSWLRYDETTGMYQTNDQSFTVFNEPFYCTLYVKGDIHCEP